MHTRPGMATQNQRRHKIINLLIKTRKRFKSVRPEPSLFSPVAFWPGTLDERIRTPRSRDKNVAMFSKTALCAEPVTVLCQEKFVSRASLPPSASASAQLSALRWFLLFRLSWWTQPTHSLSLSLLSAGYRLTSCWLAWTRHFLPREVREGERERGSAPEKIRDVTNQGRLKLSFWLPAAVFVFFFFFFLNYLCRARRLCQPSFWLFVCVIVSKITPKVLNEF